MGTVLKQELSQVFRRLSFWSALILGTFLSLVHYIREVLLPYQTPQYIAQFIAQGNLLSVFNLWLGSSFTTLEAYLFFLILPALAALPFAGSFCEELQTGFLRVKLLSCRHKRDYYHAKALAVFLAGGFTVIVPLLLNLLCTAATVPAFVPIASSARFSIFPSSMWAELYYSHPWVYTVAYLIIIFVFSGLFAQIALVVSYHLQNRIMVLLSPMLLYVFLYGICSTLSIGQFAPFCFLPLDQPVFGVSVKIIIVEAVLLAALVWVGFIREGYKKDVF